jgi:hypothetical protein
VLVTGERKSFDCFYGRMRQSEVERLLCSAGGIRGRVRSKTCKLVMAFLSQGLVPDSVLFDVGFYSQRRNYTWIRRKIRLSTCLLTL